MPKGDANRDAAKKNGKNGKTTSYLDKQLDKELKIVYKLTATDLEEIAAVIVKKHKYDPAAAEKERKHFADLCQQLGTQTTLFVTNGHLYFRANYWAKEYQAVIHALMTAKAKLEWATEWAKLAITLAFFAIGNLAIQGIRGVIAAQRGVQVSRLSRIVWGNPAFAEEAQLIGRLFTIGGQEIAVASEGALVKYLLVKGPLSLISMPLGQIAAPWVAAKWCGFTAKEIDAGVLKSLDANRKGLTEPAATLIQMNGEELVKQAHHVDGACEKAMGKNPKIRELEDNQRLQIKSTACMDYWLGVSKQVSAKYATARSKMIDLQRQLKSMKSRIWHENWKYRIAKKQNVQAAGR